MNKKLTSQDLAGLIDHTCLKPVSTSKEIDHLCREAEEYKFHSVCVPPCYVSLACRLLRKSSVAVTTVVGFPLGYNTTHVKKLEARNAIARGATELDIVMNIGLFKEGKDQYIKNEIEEILTVSSGAVCKIIIETSLLEDHEKERAAQLIVETGADFVKTSTGFSGEGATVQDVGLLKKIVRDKIKIKAAGGIKDFQSAYKIVQAGADRIGSSNSVQIYKESLENN